MLFGSVDKIWSMSVCSDSLAFCKPSGATSSMLTIAGTLDMHRATCTKHSSTLFHRMSFTDFLDNFTSVDVCHMINTSSFSLSKTWSRCALSGAWSQPVRAGGCSNHDSFLLNPQVRDRKPLLLSIPRSNLRVKCYIS